jgi:8-oxo-dGTP diphosphatase
MSNCTCQFRVLLAIDCIVFVFEKNELKLLLVPSTGDPGPEKWSLISGFLKESDSLDETAICILEKATGLSDVYMEPLKPFSNPKRGLFERTISIAYFFLVNFNELDHQAIKRYKAEWFLLNKMPDLVLDHREIVNSAIEQLRYSASRRLILFKLLQEQFTLPELLTVYESVYGKVFDVRNFNKKILSTGFLLKQTEKSWLTSKKGAFYYKLDKELYSLSFIDYAVRPEKR